MNEPCSSTSIDLPIEEESTDLPEVIRPNRQRPKECLVCGKPATGYHYEVAACNGCKTFFKRQWTDPKDYFCSKNRDCFDLTIRVEPIKCRFCRYEKCKKVGMSPSVLQGGNKKVLKRGKEQEKDEEVEKNQEITTKQAIRMMKSTDDIMQKMMDMLMFLETKLEDFRLSAFNPKWHEYPSLMPDWPLSFEPEGIFPFPPTGGPPKHRPDRKMWFFYNLMTTIEYAKTFLFFYELDLRDRTLLMRYVALACMNLHISYFSVANKFDGLIQPDGRPTKARSESHYAITVMSVAPLIRYSVQKVEYILLKAICLCNPAVPDLSHHAQEILSRERNRYAESLFDHCLRNSGPDRFATLIGMLDLLERQQRMQKDLHLLYVAPYSKKQPEEDRILLIDDIMDS